MKNLLVLSGFVGFTALPLDAVLIVHPLAQPLDIFNTDSPLDVLYPYDIDGNGPIDFTFAATISTAVGLRTERANRLVIVVDPPPNLGGPVASLPFGFLIASSFQDSLMRWNSSDLLDGYLTPEEFGASSIIQVFFSGHNTQFTERSAIAIEFEAEDGIHYGYFDISPATYIAPRITLHGWAWESQPGVPILASQVPEPSGLLLAGIATISLLSRRHRK